MSKPTAGFTLLEVLVVIVLTALLASLILPMLNPPRVSSRRVACTSNMSQIGKAMIMYADQPANGTFPTLSTDKKNPLDPNTDAQTALGLLYKQYLNDVRVFSCHSKPLPQSVLNKITPFSEKGEWKSGSFSASNPTSYGYSPGHTQEQSQVIVLADRKGTKQNSDNHGLNVGQNCLAAGGNVEFRDTVRNNMGVTDDGNAIPLVDPDIFSDGGIPNFPELESYCR